MQKWGVQGENEDSLGKIYNGQPNQVSNMTHRGPFTILLLFTTQNLFVQRWERN